jgi:hypothetical protein
MYTSSVCIERNAFMRTFKNRIHSLQKSQFPTTLLKKNSENKVSLLYFPVTFYVGKTYFYPVNVSGSISSLGIHLYILGFSVSFICL